MIDLQKISRADMVTAINASGLPVPMRALALVAVNTMHPDEVAALGSEIMRVIGLAQAGKVDEIPPLLTALKIPAEFHPLILANVKNIPAGK